MRITLDEALVFTGTFAGSLGALDILNAVIRGFMFAGGN